MENVAEKDMGIQAVNEEIAEELPYRCYEVEEYPTADRLEVERAPLN